MAKNDHGSPSTYNNHKCRCSRCRSAWADYQYELREQRESRLDSPAVVHGRPTTYSNWRCRCRDCTTAWADYQSDLRSRRAKQPAGTGG